MNMKRFIRCVIVLQMLGWTACSTINVVTDFDESVDFSKYGSFFFARPRLQQQRPGGRVRNPLFNQDVMREIKPIMESKGFTEARRREDADLLVVFYAAVQNRRDWVQPTYHIGRLGRVWHVRPGRFQNYKEGTLVIDIVDNGEKALIWQGVGKSVLDRTDPSRNLVDSVKKILERFPPQE